VGTANPQDQDFDKGNMHEYSTGKSSRQEQGCKAGNNAGDESTSRNGRNSANLYEEHAPSQSDT
jgi:hypothetical protein